MVLKNYPWPGDVRELHNVVRRARSPSADRPISPPDLALEHPPSECPGESAGHPGQSFNEDRGLQETKRRAIIQALSDSGGHQSSVARAPGIDRSTLRRKLRRLGIEPSGGIR